MLTVLSLLACNEFRLDPIDPEGPPPVQVVVEESFVQIPDAAVDMLFVIDATPSMDQELAALATDVEALLSTLDSLELDWQIGVIAASRESAQPGWLLGVPYVLSPTEPDPVARFADRLPQPGSSGEAGLAAAALALELAAADGPNAGFRRAGAVLQVVFVSDADDRSDGWLDDPVEDFIAALQQGSEPQLVGASALVGDVPDGCVSASGSAQAGLRYAEVAQRTGGRVGSICDIDFGSLLSDLGQDSVVLPVRFELRDEPLLGTLSVEVDGQPRTDWALEPGPAVVFEQAPVSGARIDLRYVVLEPGG